VYYLLDSIDFTSYNSGSAQPSLNRNYLANIPISLPPFAEQRAIAEVLGAIDDKIDSNKQIVKTAEALVESLYLHSVRGAGLVPMEPWVQVQMGSAFKGEYFSEAVVGRPLIRIRDLKTFEPQVWTTEIRPDEIIVQPGDVVVGMDAEFRSTLWLGSQAVLNQRMCRFVPADGVSRAFALETIRRDLQFYEGAKSGTTVIHLNKSDIERFRVPELRIEEHQRLGASTDALIDRLIVASQESGALGALRDALLTALLSGRIRVAAAAELVDAS
jgi:type I restriction enzyme S subunit